MRPPDAMPAEVTGGRTLLLVDDEASMLHALQRLFHHQGYRLLTAGGGEEALRLLAEQPVQVVLSDHRMPDMTGVELLTRVRTEHPDCVRMILSGFADIETIVAAINHGHIYKFLHKPWDDALLLACVAEAFARHDEARRAAIFSGIYGHTGEAIVIVDEAGRLEHANPAFTALTGYSLEDAVGLPALLFAVEGGMDDEQRAMWEVLRRDGHVRGESWVRRRNGEVFPVAVNVSALRDEQGRVVRHVALCSDISERKAREIALRESEKRFRDIMEFAPIGMVIVDLDGRLLRVNQALCDIFGYPREELEGLRMEQLTPADDLAHDLAMRRKLLDGSLAVARSEKRYTHHDGHAVWVQLTVAVLRDTQGVPQCFDAQVEDITERRRDREQIRRLAFYDALTGLPNRRLFSQHLEQILAQARRHDRAAAVMFLDLDHFKEINDTHGHEVGDELLKTVAWRLAGGLRAGDTVARQGGDEFVIALAEVTHADDALRVAEKLATRVAQPVPVGSLSLQVTTSIGIALHPAHGLDAATLLRHADLALYAVKEAGRNGYRVFLPDDVPRAAEGEAPR